MTKPITAVAPMILVEDSRLRLDEAIDPRGVVNYQPYWAVRAHLLQRLGRRREASEAFDRAIGLSEDPAVRRFLLQRRS